MANHFSALAKSHSLEWLFYALALLALAGCGEQAATHVQLSGATMGTSWHVSYVDIEGVLDGEDAKAGIQSVLDRVNASMSTYQADSEISRFNLTEPGVMFAASADFTTVFNTALTVGSQSGGAFDVTVAPLVDLWGFGPAGVVTDIPAQQAIDHASARVGLGALEALGATATAPGVFRKLAQRSLDFSALAKGYAVDEVALWLQQQGIENYLVEVGGEMQLGGLSHRGTPWRIAVEQPDVGTRSVAAAIQLTDVGLATSGDYRNYFEVEGQRYSHTIDPRTGHPVTHDLVSVTVVHNSTMLADAWATALTVLGAVQGRAVALEQGLAVYFIQGQGDEFVHSHTPAFAPYLEQTKEEG